MHEKHEIAQVEWEAQVGYYLQIKLPLVHIRVLNEKERMRKDSLSARMP